MIVFLVCYFIVGATVAACVCIEEGYSDFIDALVIPVLLMLSWPVVIKAWIKFNYNDWDRLKRYRAAQDFLIYGC